MAKDTKTTDPRTHHNTTVNLVIIALAVLAETAVLGVIYLASVHAEAVYLATLGSVATAAVGALGALLSFTGRAPAAGQPGEPPANVQVTNDDHNPVPTTTGTGDA